MKTKTENFLSRRAQVLRLKSTATEAGKPPTFSEIAKEMGVTTNAAFYYVKDLKHGMCPCCYRKLRNKLKQPTTPETLCSQQTTAK